MINSKPYAPQRQPKALSFVKQKPDTVDGSMLGLSRDNFNGSASSPENR